jgi:RNA polymerase sigma factor (sigma-70 family)
VVSAPTVSPVLRSLTVSDRTPQELSELEAASSGATALDRELAGALDRPRPAGAPATATYLRELTRRPQVSASRERELVHAAQRGDARARAQLVEAFTPLIAAAAATYRNSPTVERLELIQEGVVGLLRALERYDPARGVPFWGYGSWWVRQAMQQLVAELTRPTVLSDRALRYLARLREAHGDLVAETGREPRRDELAERSGLDRDVVDDLLAVERASRSLEAPIPGDGGQIGTFGELIADPLARRRTRRH